MTKNIDIYVKKTISNIELLDQLNIYQKEFRYISIDLNMFEMNRDIYKFDQIPFFMYMLNGRIRHLERSVTEIIL